MAIVPRPSVEMELLKEFAIAALKNPEVAKIGNTTVGGIGFVCFKIADKMLSEFKKRSKINVSVRMKGE